MQFAWAGVFMFAGFLGCFQEFHSVAKGRTLTPWGSACLRDAKPWAFWALASLGVAGSATAIAVGMFIAAV
jgi:hypothetical protein